ncbi:MAG TPA: VWA domain-containing protein, partial [Pyrinomonadaceae bacterium]|nr:VWA domain-containing protein [Pyrinomonadaceae bacterium]
MNRFSHCILVLVCAVVFVSAAHAQDEDDVVKITSRLVQVDAVVTDKDGRQVTDLTSTDFQILQDGKAQKITGFTYVPLGDAPPKQSSATTSATTSTITSSKRTARGRVITFIVDDGNCRVSASGMRASKEALQKFVNEQMLPDDRVAIYQTRAGSSMFQQYTSDKTQLLRVASKLRWYPNASGCPANDGQFFDAARVNTWAIPSVNGVKTISEETPAEKERRQLTEDRNRDNQTVGTLGVLRYALRGLERLPGRKVMFLMSDGMPYRSRSGEMLDAIYYFRDLTEQANRAAVVINSIDVRGKIDPNMINAQDDVSTLGDPLATDQVVAGRTREMMNTQDGLVFLANETGGEFYKNQDYLDKPIARGLSIEKGYYLVAYEPEGETFKGKTFYKIEIKVGRPDLKVYSRTGFMGVIDEELKKSAKTGDSELYEAIVAPLATAGMEMALTAHFGNTTADGNFIRSTIYIPGSDVTFTDEPGGLKKASFEVVAVTMDDKGKVIDEFTHSHTFKAPATAIPAIEKNGVLYSADVKVQKPGVYSFRMA